MKYNNINPHWYNVKGVYILIDDTHRLLGHVERVGNQIHREYIRQAKGDKQEDIR